MANVRGGFGDPTRQTDEFGNPIHQTGAGTTGSRTGLGAPGTTGAQGTYDPLGAPGSTGAAPTAPGFDPTSYDPGHGGGQEQLHRPVGGEAREHDPTRARHGVVDTTGMTTPITTTGTEGHGTTGTGTGYSTGGYTGVAPGGGYDTGGLRSTDMAPSGGYDTGGLRSTGMAPSGGYDTGGLRSTDIGTGDIGGQEGRRHDERKGVVEKVTLTKSVREHLPGTGGGRSH